MHYLDFENMSDEEMANEREQDAIAADTQAKSEALVRQAMLALRELVAGLEFPFGYPGYDAAEVLHDLAAMTPPAGDEMIHITRWGPREWSGAL